MKNKTEGLRMYFFVLRQLSGIDKGIQAGHAALEFAHKYGETEQYKDFIENHKTFILLNGGGSMEMLERIEELEDLQIDFVKFREPDLNGIVSAIAFILPESIYDYKPTIKELCAANPIFDGDTVCEVSIAYTINEWIKSFKLASN